MTDSLALLRTGLAAVAGTSLAVGFLVLLAPAGVRLEWPWSDEALLVGYFTIAVMAAVLVGFLGTIDGHEPNRSSERAPETVPRTTRPGQSLEAVLDRRLPTSLPARHRRRVRDRLRRAAVRAIVQRSDCSVPSARERVDRRTWTDDPVAGAFLATEETAGSRLRTLVNRLRFRRRARRTARVVLEISESAGEEP